MYRSVTNNYAAERARWLADLAAAIDEAQRIAWRLGSGEESNPEALNLYQRLEAARAEVDALRRSGWASGAAEVPPEWIELLPKGAWL